MRHQEVIRGDQQPCLKSVFQATFCLNTCYTEKLLLLSLLLTFQVGLDLQHSALA